MKKLFLLLILLAGFTISCSGGGAGNAEDDGAEEAERVLKRYLLALSAGEYLAAVDDYGGSYETLIGYNPLLSPDDHAALFEAGCMFNGITCLPLLEVKQVEQLSEGRYRLTVTLQAADGSVFTLGPCCGDDSQEPQTLFDFHVGAGEDGLYRVEDLPPYMP